MIIQDDPFSFCHTANLLTYLPQITGITQIFTAIYYKTIKKHLIIKCLKHHKQVITYLKISNLKLGILVNFNTIHLNSNIIRKVNKL
ncbi:hypothetical protein FO442_04305 [Fluviicola chungangensis]|uniref:GxxExxY protein n=1 Tax=Fluviicola chungangensis TaxID=2597671 RepID=A0A556N3I7_9FLAO|nr:hypothetical protein FO442_04305 [Fluviicola chungangensis]